MAEEGGRMIAIMGASGNVGSKVADLLLQNSQGVRVFGRSAERLEPFGRRGAEIVVGDAIRVDDVEMLFKDAVSALVVLPDNVAEPPLRGEPVRDEPGHHPSTA